MLECQIEEVNGFRLVWGAALRVYWCRAVRQIPIISCTSQKMAGFCPRGHLIALNFGFSCALQRNFEVTAVPTKEYALTMARYNLWQNENLADAASTLSVIERRKDRGAFFGSIEKTFSHIFWADQVWLSRFADTEPPAGGLAASLDLIDDWHEFRAQRSDFDRRILDWADSVSPDWFGSEPDWKSGASQNQLRPQIGTLVIQLFNHQTHHRGQIHAMLTAGGAKPGDTDIHKMPKHYLDM
jgi:uncharacterized damage-inducible protein DinB